jgi:hypothetical protein
LTTRQGRHTLTRGHAGGPKLTSEDLPSEDWQRARLIPIAGIRGQDEQEARATSAFLAVLSVVPAFAQSILVPFGAPRGKVETFSEVRFKDAAGKSHRPDGAILASRGAKAWSALVEVKTGTAPILEEQVNRYLDIARDNSFDCVITISNDIVASPTEVPYSYDRRKTRRVALSTTSRGGGFSLSRCSSTDTTGFPILSKRGSLAS